MDRFSCYIQLSRDFEVQVDFFLLLLLFFLSAFCQNLFPRSVAGCLNPEQYTSSPVKESRDGQRPSHLQRSAKTKRATDSKIFHNRNGKFPARCETLIWFVDKARWLECSLCRLRAGAGLVHLFRVIRSVCISRRILTLTIGDGEPLDWFWMSPRSQDLLCVALVVLSL